MTAQASRPSEANKKLHAFLIMAHNDYPLLQKLVALLDSDNADVYVHIDKKSKTVPELNTSKSRVYFVDRISIHWGEYSQIQCEINMLKEALKGEYEYYHLLSGADLPLVTSSRLDDFFAANKSKNYIDIDPEFGANSAELDKIRYYHFFLHVKAKRIRYALIKLSTSIQRLLGIDRTKKIRREIYKGANWFSITHSLAEYTVQCEKSIRKTFKHCLCADEMFLQTVAMNSQYRDTIVRNNYRFVDWSTGTSHPKILVSEDMDRLLSSGAFFGRKFSTAADEKVISDIYNHLLETETNKADQA